MDREHSARLKHGAFLKKLIWQLPLEYEYHITSFLNGQIAGFPNGRKPTVPLNLRKLRVTKGISQEQLADAADLERRYVGAIERGEENPTVRTLDKLAQALGIHVSEFFIEQGLSSGLIPGLRPGRKASVRRRS